jgi:hypothetical protein
MKSTLADMLIELVDMGIFNLSTEGYYSSSGKNFDWMEFNKIPGNQKEKREE